MNTYSQYDRFKTITLEQGFDIIQTPLEDTIKGKVMVDGVKVSADGGIRLRSFIQNGVHCQYPGCELHGSFFAIERHKKQDGAYHLNLYGFDRNGEETLFTVDHVLARSLGGIDELPNTQTMCFWHNVLKEVGESTVKKLDALCRKTGYNTADAINETMAYVRKFFEIS